MLWIHTHSLNNQYLKLGLYLSLSLSLSLSDKPFRACHQGPTGGQGNKYKVYCPPWPPDTPTQPAVPTRLPMGKSEVCTSRGQGSPGRADDLPRTQARTGQDWAVGVTRTRRGAFSICPSSPNPGRYIKTYIVLVVFGRTDPGAQKASPPKDPSALVLKGAAGAGLHGNLPHNGPDPRARLSVAVSVLGQDSKRRTKAPLVSNQRPGCPVGGRKKYCHSHCFDLLI